VRTWVEGGDPYEKKHLLLVYPPIVLRLFIWAKLMPPEVSARVWICLAAACAVIGALASVRIRRQLGLANVSASFGVAVILYSTPVLFALERGNYDLLIVPLVVAAVMLMRRETETADVMAAFLLAVGNMGQALSRPVSSGGIGASTLAPDNLAGGIRCPHRVSRRTPTHALSGEQQHSH